jgi:hypothetical protein
MLFTHVPMQLGFSLAFNIVPGTPSGQDFKFILLRLPKTLRLEDILRLSCSSKQSRLQADSWELVQL